MKTLLAAAAAFVVSALVAAGVTMGVYGQDGGPGAEDVARAWVEGIRDGNYGVACDQLAPSLLGGTGKTQHDGCVANYAAPIMYGALEVYVTVKLGECTVTGRKATCTATYAPGGKLRIRLEDLPELGWRVVALG